MSTIAKYLRLVLIGFGVVTIVQSQGLPLERFTDCVATMVDGRELTTCKILVASSAVPSQTALASSPEPLPAADAPKSELPTRVAFAGAGWTARQGSPTTGFAGLAIKATDRVGGIYSWTSVQATASNNTFSQGAAKPLYKLGPVLPWVVASGGVAAGGGDVAFAYGGGVLVSFDLRSIRVPGHLFVGAQVQRLGEATGIPAGGVNISPGFGYAFQWGER